MQGACSCKQATRREEKEEETEQTEREREREKARGQIRTQTPYQYRRKTPIIYKRLSTSDLPPQDTSATNCQSKSERDT